MTDLLETDRPADYLMRLAVSDLGAAYKSLVLDLMRCPAGGSVVDLGCGPGADLGRFADAVGPSGQVLGIDDDPSALSAAAELTAGMPQVSVRRGDVHHLDVADRSVDRVHTDRVLQHVQDPARVLAEVARVLRPGGRAGFAEPDWHTLVVDHPDPVIPDAYRRFVTSEVVRNARIGRQLPALSQRQGLDVVSVVPVTAVFRDVAEADRIFGFQRVTQRAVESGFLTAAQGDAWLTHLRTAPFFAAVTLLVTIAQR